MIKNREITLNNLYKLLVLFFCYSHSMDIRSIINPCESSKADAIKEIKKWLKQQQNVIKKNSSSVSVDEEYVSEGRIACDWGCGKSFTRRSYLDRHKRTVAIHERERKYKGWPEQRYECPICHYKYIVYYHLSKHMVDLHRVPQSKLPEMIGTGSKPKTRIVINDKTKELH